MINLDALVIEFIKNNLLTISLILAILKILATETKITADDKIINLLLNFVKPLTWKSDKKV